MNAVAIDIKRKMDLLKQNHFCFQLFSIQYCPLVTTRLVYKHIIDNFVSMSWPPFNKRSLALKRVNKTVDETKIHENSWYIRKIVLSNYALHRGEKKRKVKKKKELKLFPLQYFQLSIDYSRIFLLMSVCTYVTRLNIAILFKYILKV